MRRMKPLTFAVGLVLAATLAGCGGPDPERNVIVNKAPFYEKELPYREGSEDEIISTVKAFAREHGMDYLGGPGHPTLDPGQFNLHAAGKMLNLGVIRVVTTLPNMQIAAIARENPTANDKVLVAEFIRRLEQIQQLNEARGTSGSPNPSKAR